jgi:hypothetical protein
MVGYSATIEGLKPGRYEIRARAVDLNDFAQPQPRPSAKSGRNGIQVRHMTWRERGGAFAICDLQLRRARPERMKRGDAEGAEEESS